MSFTFLDYAREVLEGADIPLTPQEIWDAGEQAGLSEKLGSAGKTPERTLSAKLYAETKGDDSSVFMRVHTRPAKFFLKSKSGQLPDTERLVEGGEKITFLDYAQKVLADADRPLTPQEIWDYGELKGLPKKPGIGKTPELTLSARLYVETKDGNHPVFMRVPTRPARFFLQSKSGQLSDKLVEKAEKITERREKEKEKEAKAKYTERQLHPLLSYFAYTRLFSRDRSVFTKTILHEESKKSGYSEWSHPDMVGCYLPVEEWGINLFEFAKISGDSTLKLFSFEIKRSLTKGTYRESFFQAVSNSSWANEGYLVAAEVSQENDLRSELERLSASFGIGVIQLDLADIDSSRVLYPAQTKLQLDWETMNKLAEQNADFQKFLKDVKIDFDSKRIHTSEYDEIITDPESYIKKITK